VLIEAVSSFDLNNIVKAKAYIARSRSKVCKRDRLARGWRRSGRPGFIASDAIKLARGMRTVQAVGRGHRACECGATLVVERRQAQGKIENKKPVLSRVLALKNAGADETNRTSDLLITNQLLYQLSYISDARHSSKKERLSRGFPQNGAKYRSHFKERERSPLSDQTLLQVRFSNRLSERKNPPCFQGGFLFSTRSWRGAVRNN
jgi:hypothetical protein